MISGCQTIRRKARQFLRKDSGAAIVEFAVLLPLMLVVFGLIVEGGRLLWSYQNTITGVRDTTRYLGRIAPSDMCGTAPSASINSYTTLATDQLAALSSAKIDVDLQSLALECVAGTDSDGETIQYRVDPAPIAVVTASLTITELPFAQLFRLVGVTPGNQIATTVTDRSRVFGP